MLIGVEDSGCRAWVQASGDREDIMWPEGRDERVHRSNVLQGAGTLSMLETVGTFSIVDSSLQDSSK